MQTVQEVLRNIAANVNKIASESQLPEAAAGDAGKVITVDASGEWTLAVPVIAHSSTDAGKVLMVASDGTWKLETLTIPTLPAITADDAGKPLIVAADGTWTLGSAT